MRVMLLSMMLLLSVLLLQVLLLHSLLLMVLLLLLHLLGEVEVRITRELLDPRPFFRRWRPQHEADQPHLGEQQATNNKGRDQRETAIRRTQKRGQHKR